MERCISKETINNKYHGCALSAFVQWGENNFWDLYFSKTRKLIIDFRQNSDARKACILHDEDVQIVDLY